jgi:hypothetical protein
MTLQSDNGAIMDVMAPEPIERFFYTDRIPTLKDKNAQLSRISFEAFRRTVRPGMLWNPFVARITRELRQDHDHSSAVLTVLQGGPTPEPRRTLP